MADRGRRAFPFSSPVIFEYDVKRHYATHRERVKHMVPAVDNTPPEDFGHFHYNAKRAMIQAERLFEIDRENRILLEKMEKYNAYKSSDKSRAWSCRTGLNFQQGMVFNAGTNSLQIDHLNLPVNRGTTAGGRTKYNRQQELQHLAQENLKILKAIESRKPFYSAEAWEHEHLETCSRIERLGTFRGPKSAQHLPTSVDRSLQLAKSMRSSKWLPGTAGYQADLAQSVRRSNTLRSGSIRVRSSRSRDTSFDDTNHSRAVSNASTTVVRQDAYSRETDAALAKSQSMRRVMSSREPRARTATANLPASASSTSRDRTSSGPMQDPEFRSMFAGGRESSEQIVMRVNDIPSSANLFPSADEAAAPASDGAAWNPVSEDKSGSELADHTKEEPAHEAVLSSDAAETDPLVKEVSLDAAPPEAASGASEL